MKVEISLYVPPSLNAQAYLLAAPKRKIAPGYSLHIALPVNMRGDLDNRVKPLSDVLVAASVLPDDKHAARITVERSAFRDGMAHITITDEQP